MFVNLRIINQHLNTQGKTDSDLIGLSLKNRFETAYCLNTPEERLGVFIWRRRLLTFHGANSSLR